MNRTVFLSAGVEALGSEPPTRFRIFRKGENVTDQGVFTFDDAAAASVMAAHRRNGNDPIIDLQHQSLLTAKELAVARADAADARGYYSLSVVDGELWAENVRWTEDGAERIRSLKQRYPSPAFTHDESGRILEVINIGLVSQPGTFNAHALIAASKSLLSQGSAVARAQKYLAKVKSNGRRQNQSRA